MEWIGPCLSEYEDIHAVRVQSVKMASEQERKELDERAKQGKEVVPGGRGGKSVEAQERLAEGRRKGGKKGGSSRKEENTEDQKAGEEATKQEEKNVDASKARDLL
ncbi:hypothetical protein R1sor_006516 [Riccia sorocarpa]|uniref:Small EDRK-rich factor-like N-terminal domain-containing protein n=1 Tax=Riccia sorocarpa TaxID=122646 RepID=A0ABD3HMQ3_9MARC